VANLLGALPLPALLGACVSVCRLACVFERLRPATPQLAGPLCQDLSRGCGISLKASLAIRALRVYGSGIGNLRGLSGLLRQDCPRKESYMSKSSPCDLSGQ
jgi:hypothetical protein